MYSTVDVLIVGSGPSGLALAIDLQRYKVSFRIIDKDTGLAKESRALGIHSRTIEMLKQRGMEKEFIEKGLTVKEINIFDKGNEIGALKISSLHAPYPYVLELPQSETEQHLKNRLNLVNTEVEFGKELIDFIQKEGFIEATVQNQENLPEIIKARWVVGCDGAKSTVREKLAIKTTDDAFEEFFLLADLDIEWEHQKDKIYLWMDKEGVAATIPLPDKNHWRVILNYPTRNDELHLSEEFFEKVFKERSGRSEVIFKNSSWFSKFKVKEKQASKYHKGRIFLVGDAAHIHSPLGAQGMNTGIQDAFNLAWKLSMVIKGVARNSLLDTYEMERKPVADKVTFFTGASTTAMTSRNPLVRLMRNSLLKGIVNFSFLQQKIIWQLSELGVSYKSGRISSLAEKKTLKLKLGLGAGIASGERAPQARGLHPETKKVIDLFEVFSKPGFSLLVFTSGPSDETNEKKLREIVDFTIQEGNDWIHPVLIFTDNYNFDNIKNALILIDSKQQINSRYKAKNWPLYLIRPDGYVAFRGKNLHISPLKKFWKDLRNL